MSQAPVFTHNCIPYSKPEDIVKLFSHHFSLAPTLVNPTASDPPTWSAQDSPHFKPNNDPPFPPQPFFPVKPTKPSPASIPPNVPDLMVFILPYSKPVLVVSPLCSLDSSMIFSPTAPYSSPGKSSR
ncbi:hypothetical protein ISCGN_017624 [Ixodes scapularis]